MSLPPTAVQAQEISLIESGGTLLESTQVVGWGYQYGVGMPEGLSGVTSIAAGIYHAVALKHDGTVEQWKSSPMPKEALSGVTAIAAG